MVALGQMKQSIQFNTTLPVAKVVNSATDTGAVSVPAYCCKIAALHPDLHPLSCTHTDTSDIDTHTCILSANQVNHFLIGHFPKTAAAAAAAQS